MEYRRDEIVSGLFICLAIAVFGLFAFRVGGFDLLGMFKGRVVLCKAYFSDVKTLEKGAEVKVGGRRVGKITAVRIVGNPRSPQGEPEPSIRRQLIELEFELSDASLRLIPATAKVALSQDSVLSAHFLELDPGVWRGETPATILKAGFAGEIVIPAREGTGFDDRLSELVTVIEPVVKELNVTMQTINANLLTAENIDRVERILTNLDTTIENAREISRHAGSLLDRSQDPRFHSILDNLQEGTEGLRERWDALQADAHVVFTNAAGVLTDNRAEIAEIFRRLNRAAWQAEMALRKIRSNPRVLVFGDGENDLEAETSDESEIRYSGRVKPYAQRDEN